MFIPITSQFNLNETYLFKAKSIEKITELLSFAENQKMTKYASKGGNGLNQTDLINLFANMLRCLNLNTEGNIDDVFNNLMAKSNTEVKSAAIKSSNKGERSDEIKIASKEIKDSHYQVDVSKDIVNRNGRNVHMISCYMRDAYLGRYIIKRNYFYTNNRESAANDAYDEILTKMTALKDRYYNGISTISEITPQAKIILDGVISEIKMEEDSLGTTVDRHQYDHPSHK